ncbi:mechanosensitive ion channel domain-containing protein [Pseudoalteromonas byunsanensis]|uniref:Small-conductance mechanosensitive channel n=1 Tax=Pseudoalteromonas byunsanensis TaxID=327939 RepID=A0A1S1N8P7_9GAMM|nr:mechanosensitive ion channel domain-containing protein [Pseudoalteromonas byunsanensis]OHU97765.1 mechanosensitive ion channel protein [Pseudoalteromonas byunsanensis]
MSYLTTLLTEQYRLVITVFVLLLFPIIFKYSQRVLERVTQGKIDAHRQLRAELLLKIITAIVLICLLLVFWGIELRGLLVLGSSLFAMLGVALFAGWSLLSNLTSFLLMFIQNYCRVGNWVRIVEGANYIEGCIIEMGLMNVVLKNVDGHRVIYPNNLFVTRPVLVLCEEPSKPKAPAPKRVLGPKK